LSENQEQWDVIIEFYGGPLDGEVLTSDSGAPGFDPSRVLWILRMVASSLDIAERQEKRPGNLLTWRVPHRLLEEMANTENWSAMKRMALMEHHEYHITRIAQDGPLAMLEAHYQGYGH